MNRPNTKSPFCRSWYSLSIRYLVTRWGEFWSLVRGLFASPNLYKRTTKTDLRFSEATPVDCDKLNIWDKSFSNGLHNIYIILLAYPVLPVFFFFFFFFFGKFYCTSDLFIKFLLGNGMGIPHLQIFIAIIMIVNQCCNPRNPNNFFWESVACKFPAVFIEHLDYGTRTKNYSNFCFWSYKQFLFWAQRTRIQCGHSCDWNLLSQNYWSLLL